MKILETDRLILRHLHPTDLESLFALYNDQEVRRYFPEGTLTYEETKEEVEGSLMVYHCFQFAHNEVNSDFHDVVRVE